MPLVAVNLSQAVLSLMKELIDAGKYASLESFIEVASFNQLALERSGGAQLKNSGLTVTGAPKASERKTAASAPQKKRSTIGKIERQVYLLDRPDQAEDVEVVLTPFRKVASTGAAPKPLPMMSREEQGDHIFGQVNRLFPMKLVCRWVMRASHSHHQWPSLSEVSEALADDAARLGSLLEQQDLAKDRKRDDCLATGLPRRANGPSKDRFLSQFVARVTRGGHIFPGAMGQYRLASIQDQTLALSQRGIDFALIDNPLLDGGLNTSPTALSDEETKFLFAHILEWVGQEQSDIQAVIGAIATGSSTPPSLTTALRAYLPSDWNDGEIQTHVSGLIARMSELGLVRRRWHGRHVEYELSNVATSPREKVREAG
jgi:hypothetical protein